jgi:hypothetical protein
VERKLIAAHDDFGYQILRPRHNWLTAEQDTHIIQLKDLGFATEFRRVIDARTVLHKRFIAINILRFTSIDRYLIECTASAT